MLCGSASNLCNHSLKNVTTGIWVWLDILRQNMPMWVSALWEHTLRMYAMQIMSSTSHAFSSHIYLKIHNGKEGLSVVVFVAMHSEFSLEIQTHACSKCGSCRRRSVGTKFCKLLKRDWLHTCSS